MPKARDERNKQNGSLGGLAPPHGYDTRAVLATLFWGKELKYAQEIDGSFTNYKLGEVRKEDFSLRREKKRENNRI